MPCDEYWLIKIIKPMWMKAKLNNVYISYKSQIIKNICIIYIGGYLIVQYLSHSLI